MDLTKQIDIYYLTNDNVPQLTNNTYYLYGIPPLPNYAFISFSSFGLFAELDGRLNITPGGGFGKPKFDYSGAKVVIDTMLGHEGKNGCLPARYIYSTIPETGNLAAIMASGQAYTQVRARMNDELSGRPKIRVTLSGTKETPAPEPMISLLPNALVKAFPWVFSPVFGIDENSIGEMVYDPELRFFVEANS